MTERTPSTPSDPVGLASYFQEARCAFDQAVRKAGGADDRDLWVAGLSVRLSFAGAALVSHIMPALEHLAAPVKHSAPALVLGLWDRLSTGVNLPPPPWNLDGFVVRGEVEGMNDERIHTAVDAAYFGFSLLDTIRNEALFNAPDPARIPYYESSSPLRSILSWWLARNGRQLVHAGAVGLPGRGGVLLAGRGGSGKSVSSLLCLCDGLDFAGDDYVALEFGERPFVHSLYNSAKVNPADIGRFPSLRNAMRHPGETEEKALLFAAQIFPERTTRGFPVRAILLPRVKGNGRTELKETSPAFGLRSLAPSTIFQLPGAGREAFEAIARFVKTVPNFILEIGSDGPAVPAVIREFLSR